MPPSPITWLTTLLTLFAFTTAQSFNLTLTFSPSTNDSTTSHDSPCANRDNPDSITFSTYFIPIPGAGGCVNLADAFAGHTSRLPASYSLLSTNGSYESANISFVTRNHAAYDPAANYSQVIYAQEDAGEQSLSADERYFAVRDVYFYSGEDCLERGVDEQGDLFPWYQSDCRSAGDCERFPFSVKSFRIYRAEVDSKKVEKMREKKNKCVLGAEFGAGSSVRPQWVMVLAVMGAMAVMLAI